MTEQINQVSNALGRLEAGLDAIKETLAEVRKEQGYSRIVQRETATQLQSIPALAQRIEEIEQAIPKLAQKDDLAETQKTVKAHEDLVQRGAGVFALTALVCNAIGAGIVLFVQWLIGRH